MLVNLPDGRDKDFHQVKRGPRSMIVGGFETHPGDDTNLARGRLVSWAKMGFLFSLAQWLFFSVEASWN